MSRGNQPESSPLDCRLQEACAIAKEAAARAIGCLGACPDRRERQKVLTAFRHVIIPVKRPGRKRKEGITAAHRDWKNGMRGVALYRKYIPGWESHGYWRRKGEESRLRNAISTRDRREGGTRKIQPADSAPSK